MWVFGTSGCLLIIVMLCVLRCICKLFFQGHVKDQQVASFVGSIAVLTKNKGGDMGKCSTCEKCGPALTWKSQWGPSFSGQDPCPWIGSPVGNQTCIVPSLLWDLLLLKNSLTLNWGSKCLLSIFNFLKSELDLPSMEHNHCRPLFPLHCNILLCCI